MQNLKIQEQELTHLVNQNDQQLNDDSQSEDTLSDISQENIDIYQDICNPTQNTIRRYQNSIRSYFSKEQTKELFYFLSFLIFANIYYIKTLKGCYQTKDECTAQIVQYLEDNKKNFFLYSLLFSTLIIYSYHNHKKWLILIFANIFSLYVYDHSMKFENHGIISFILLIFFGGLIIFTYSIIYNIYISSRSSKFRFFVILNGLFFIIGVMYIKRLRNSCENFDKGLGGITYSQDQCKVQSPERCMYDIFEGFFAVKTYMEQDCKLIQQTDSFIEQMEENEIYKYPETRDLSGEFDTEFFYQNYIIEDFQLRNQKDYSWREISLKKQNGQPHVQIHVQRRETTIERVQQIQENQRISEAYKKNSLFEPISEDNKNYALPNVMIINIDAISRQGIKRYLPNTFDWLNNNYYANTDKNSSFNIYQFMKYNAIGGFTAVNQDPFWFGDNFESKKQLDSFIDSYHNKGYVTAYTTNSCENQIVLSKFGKNNTDQEKVKAKDIQYSGKITPFDHEFFNLFCDPGFQDKNDGFSNFKGPYSIFKRCLYGRDSNEYQFEYLTQFWKQYEETPKISFMHFMDGHEGTGENVKNLDENLVNYLKNQEKNGVFNNTILIFMSDHGFHMSGIFRVMGSLQAIKETGMSSLFIGLPKNFDKNKTEQIKLKEQELLSTWDLHWTFLDVVGEIEGYGQRNGQSLFQPMFLKNRSCKEIGVEFNELCMCEQQQ